MNTVSKVMILVVDRDDDFGEKGGVQTPVIGLENAMSAAMALGTEDPEDSDVNALLAAVNIYKDMKKDKNDVEIALICGNKKVGPKSDMALIDELNIVMDKVKPDRAILVGDGAEDEYVYPIISSRLPIDSVRKVYVKQSPNVESFFYIVSRTLREPEKKRRFLGPIGILLTLIAMIFIVIGISAFSATESTTYLYGLAAPIVVLLIGVIILYYAYDWGEFLENHIVMFVRQLRESSISATFTLLAIGMFVAGLVIAFYSIRNIYGNGFIYIALQFVSALVWPFGFGIFLSILGKIFTSLIEEKRIPISFVTRSIMLFGVLFILQAIIDVLNKNLGYSTVEDYLVLIDIIVGITLTLTASIIQYLFKRHFAPSDEGSVDEI